MTETIDGAMLDEALSLIDRQLGSLQRRKLVASAEVSDMLLDLRMILTFVPAEPASAN
ncbi:MAG: hypothetical protein GWP47_13875 [Actinobacteria bacterium]|jgi:hypothetical protein|nr:hypothetical protein [Actinomycetota bacterium]NCG38096.1 hypothetical protein [Actinomycetota bacterium]